MFSDDADIIRPGRLTLRTATPRPTRAMSMVGPEADLALVGASSMTSAGTMPASNGLPDVASLMRFGVVPKKMSSVWPAACSNCGRRSPTRRVMPATGQNSERASFCHDTPTSGTASRLGRRSRPRNRPGPGYAMASSPAIWGARVLAMNETDLCFTPATELVDAICAKENCRPSRSRGGAEAHRAAGAEAQCVRPSGSRGGDGRRLGGGPRWPRASRWAALACQ